MTQETSRLIIAVDSTGVPKATVQLDELTAASAKAEAATKSLGGASQASGQTHAGAAAGISQAERAASKYADTETLATARTLELEKASKAAQAALSANFAGFSSAARDAQAAIVQLKTGTISATGMKQALGDLKYALSIGAIEQDTYTAALKLADKAKLEDIALTKAQSAANKGSINSRTAYSLSALLSDAASGQLSRSKRELAALGNETGLINKLFTPVGAGIGIVVAGLGAYVAAAYRAETQTSDLNKAILATGGAAGVTTGQLSAMAVALSDGVHSGADIHDALIAVASSGQFAGTQIQTVAKAALDMADVTGQSVQQAVAEFTKLGEDPVTAAVKLNSTYHFLTDSVYDQIRALEQQGNTEDATRVAVDALAQAMDKASANAQTHIGVLHGMWNELKRDLALPADLLTAAANQATPDAAGQNAVALQMLQMRAKQGYFTQDANGNFATTAKFSALRPGFQSDMQFYLDMYNRTRDAAADAANAAQALADKQKDLQGVMSDQNWVDKTIKGYDKVKDRAQAAADVSAKLFNLVLHGKALPEGVNIASGSKGGFSGPGFDYLVKKEMGAGSGSTRAPTVNDDQARTRALADFRQEVEAAGKLRDQQDKQAAAAKSYADNLDQQAATQKAQLDLSLQSVGMSDREIQQAQALLQLRERYNHAVQSINGQRAAVLAVNPKADVSGFDAEIAAQERSLDTQVEQQKAYYANLAQLEGDWREGAVRGMKQFMDSAANVAGQTEALFENAFSGLTDSLVNFVTTGKLNFKDLGNSIIQTLLRIELQVLESKILSSILWSVGGYGAAADSAAGSVIDSIWGPSTHAKGDVFNSPSLAKYSNGVYTTPQFFTYAKGGVFAEAGPEAVMPLTRGPDGKLGVKAQGASGGDVIVNVQNNGGQPAQVSQSKDGNGNDIITVMINAAANEVDSRIMRGGSTYKAINQTFGVSRRGVPVAG